MSRTTAPVLTAVAALAAATAVAAGPAAATTNWTATGTRALQLAHAVRLAAPSGGRELQLTIGLAPRDPHGLDALIRRQNTRGSGAYHRYLKPGEFTRRFGATVATADAVAGYLRGRGMRSVHIAPNRLQVGAVATVAQAERAFHTDIARFRQFGRTVLANTSAALVPSALAGKVTAVLGLSTLGFAAGAPAVPPKLSGYFPNEFVKVYNGGKTRAGAGTALAVIAEGNLARTVTDLRIAERRRHLPRVPVSLVHAGRASKDTSGVDEWDLDTQTSTGVAPRAKRLYIYVASSLTNASIAKAINKWAAQDVARSASASLGECDALPYADGSMRVDDLALKQATAQGQTFFASTGDTGSSCAVAPTNGVPGSGPPDTEYPGSSPFAVAVGGTTLDTDSKDNYGGEIAWNAGGGGISPVEHAPRWQNNVSPSAAASARGVPDIALDADPNTGALIFVKGVKTQIGGTSLSTPLAMGLWTRLQSSHRNRLGVAGPRLYALYRKAQGGTPLPPTSVRGLHDITLGTIGAYPATPGYDYATGLGSFNLNPLSRALG